MKKELPELELYIAGKGTYEPNLKGMLKAMNDNDVDEYVKWATKDNFIDKSIDVREYFRACQTDDIRLLGYINHDTLKEELALADIMVAPSKAPEAFGLVTIESMAAGVYPIVSNHSGLKNVVDIIEEIDNKITSNMRIHFDKDKIDLVNMTRTVMSALEYVKHNDPSDKLKKVSLDFDWKNICESILES